jgi:sulfite reductase (NADPH) flavoprotein alpha-component
MKKYTRADPFLSQIKERQLLTGFGSTKITYHIVLDIDAWEGSFKVGDSLAILPSNSLKEVDAVLRKMGCVGDEQVVDSRQKDLLTLHEFLTKRVNLSRIKGKEGRLIDHVGPMAAQDLVQMVMPLLPRFYSITNSPLVFKHEIHLLVAYVQYVENGEERLGVGSHFLCDFAKTVPIYVQPSNHFTLPNDFATSLIMIGPGTGVAPFRAFMQEREQLNAKGKNWLFFWRKKSKDRLLL